MRIGEVSAKYHISVDNLYYYISYGLLVPPRPKSQYDFDEQTLKDLEQILDLKSMEFSLQEIHRIISLYRILKPAGWEDISELISIFKARREACEEEEKHQKQIKNTLDLRIKELLVPHAVTEAVRGVPIRMLDLLCCPECGESLSISGANMNLKDIFSGMLSCTCGYRASIENGILMTPNRNISLHDKPDLRRELYKDLPPKLISLFQKSYNWMCEKLKENPPDNWVVMETYVNAWFFMHNHLDKLDPSSRYIVIDKYPETLLMYKKLIEQQNIPLDILYIADSSTKFPLKENCVDLNIDFFAINEHNFYHQSFLIDKLLPYLKKDAILLGTYFYFEGAPKSRKTLLDEYPESSVHNFDYHFFENSMKKTPFAVEDEVDCGCIMDTGNNLGFGFHHKGEKMGLRPYICRRREM